MGRKTTKNALPQTATRCLTPASQQRRQVILDAAAAVFLADGYQQTAMDRIAQHADTTKRTLYDHFGNKETLFAAVIEQSCAALLAGLPDPDSLPTQPAAGLRRYADKLGQLLGAPACLRLQRVLIAEAPRYPQFAVQLYDTALQGAEQLLANYLRRCVAQGSLIEHDSQACAHMLMDVLVHAASLRVLLAGQRKNGRAAAAEPVAQAIALLLQAYRAPDPAGASAAQMQLF